ncbi:MAG: hypothetical protein HY040_24340 [Planctomycetes bacterium]|nr:hypothetical protein [Planctomycetota bacterium]
MATNKSTKNATSNPEQLRKEWLDRLSALVTRVTSWATELDWSTRLIEKKIEDSQIGTHEAPALLLQKGTTRLLLEPIAPSAPGAEGVVDLYSMPAYDDIATFYYRAGAWHLHYMFSGEPSVGEIRESPSKPVSKRILQRVLQEMTRNAAQAL